MKKILLTLNRTISLILSKIVSSEVILPVGTAFAGMQ